MVQFCPGRRQAGALLSTLALAAVLGLYSYRSKSPLRRDGSVTLLHNDAPPPRSPSAAARPGAAELPPGMERSAAWIPTMQPGVVAKNAAIFPSWHQCWAPLCRSCARLIHAPHGDELAGLHVYVLTAGGEQERTMRQVIRATWGNEAVQLGAKVLFVFGKTIRQWGQEEAERILQESHAHRDISLVDIRGPDGWAVEDGYRQLANKVLAAAAAGLEVMPPHRSWFMKVDSDTYVNMRRLATDLAAFKAAAKAGQGAWQYAGYHNNGGVAVRGASAQQGENRKEALWAEPEYAALRSKYPPYAFGAAGWVLGYDALAHLVERSRDAAVVRPKFAEDALVGVLLENCTACEVVRWQPCEIMGGTTFPFAALSPQETCPSFSQRVGMAAADQELPRFACLITLSEIKSAPVFLEIHHIVTHGQL
mmetsp:Transcript_33601/g.87148  ORF Transcript_33601/g.87148 Transcript_33601/m.87148 type:complete len:422 (+) Transcript_33601:178-1443(+)